MVFGGPALSEQLDVEIEVARPEGPSVLKLRGDLDLHTAPGLRERLAALIDAGSLRVVVDLSEVAFMDSTGLGVLVGAARRARAQGGTLAVGRPSPHAQRVLEVTGLTAALTATA